jgi:hypothetical protein
LRYGLITLERGESSLPLELASPERIRLTATPENVGEGDNDDEEEQRAASLDIAISGLGPTSSSRDNFLFLVLVRSSSADGVVCDLRSADDDDLLPSTFSDLLCGE